MAKRLGSGVSRARWWESGEGNRGDEVAQASKARFAAQSQRGYTNPRVGGSRGLEMKLVGDSAKPIHRRFSQSNAPDHTAYPQGFLPYGRAKRRCRRRTVGDHLVLVASVPGRPTAQMEKAGVLRSKLGRATAVPGSCFEPKFDATPDFVRVCYMMKFPSACLSGKRCPFRWQFVLPFGSRDMKLSVDRRG